MSKETSDSVLTIETRGIEPIPDEERHGKPIELFWMWFGANIGILGITLGAILVTFHGLNVLQSMFVGFTGVFISFIFVGILSAAGKIGGAPGLTLSRAVFGVRGNWGPTLVSWLSFVGWETVMCTTAAFALLAVLRFWGIDASVLTTTICMLIIVVLAATIGLFGHATIMWIQKWLTWIFGALTVLVVGLLVAHVNWSAAFAARPASLSNVIASIGFIASATGLGWVSAGADYARYLPRSTRSGSIVKAAAAGATIPLFFLITMGALMAVGDASLANATDPVAAIGAALPKWMLIPYLLTAVVGLIAGADLSMYSSGLNLITGGIKVKRTTAVVVDAVLITIGGLYITVIAKDFYGPFMTFLSFLAIPLTAWGGVFVCDMTARRIYDEAALMDQTRNGAYWYRAGVNWPAFLAWIVGIVLGLLFTQISIGDKSIFAGAFAHTWVGENGLGWLVAGLSAAAFLFVTRGRQRVSLAA